MVMGLFPVVGVPLPLFSYGGTDVVSIMFGSGLITYVYVNRNRPLGRNNSVDVF
jgi:rod shape determining protein RodA